MGGLRDGEGEAALGDQLAVGNTTGFRLAEGDRAAQLEYAALDDQLIAGPRGRDERDVHVDGGVRVVPPHPLTAHATERDSRRRVHYRRDHAAVHDAVRVRVTFLELEREAGIAFLRLLEARAYKLDERDADLLPLAVHSPGASEIRPRTTALAMRATRAICLTSCTRTMSAPLAIEIGRASCRE